MKRITFTEIWMNLAKNLSKRSCDPKHQVGCVIVDQTNDHVLAQGYNGDEKGGPNTRDSLETGQSGFIHAEINALIKLNTTYPCKKTMYVTLSPCIVCAKAIINAGINKVVYLEEYKPEGIELLVQRDVEVLQYYHELRYNGISVTEMFNSGIIPK